MPKPYPDIGVLFRTLERKAINSSATITPELVREQEDVRNARPLKSLMQNAWQTTMSDDRTLHVPPHVGRNVFPCHSLFARLIRLAHQRPPRLAVRDVNAGTEANHIQLLGDVLSLRERIWSHLTEDVRRGLDQRQEVYIAVLCPGGYEYTISMLAVLALGAAAVPMTVVLPPEEALYFVTKSRSAAVIVSSGALKLGAELERQVKHHEPASGFVCIPAEPSTFTPCLKPLDFKISSDLYLDDNAPGIVIFTSGTTGRPKGAVMRRGYTFEGSIAVADHFAITQDDVLQHLLPVHHATGLGIMFFPFLVTGALIEFKSGSFDPEYTWNRWLQGGLTFFSGVPTIYMRMKRHYEQVISKRPNREQYVAAARQLRACLCGTSALPKPIADFWTDILGKKILLRYGATEIGAVFKAELNDPNVPDGSVGTVFAGCDIKLSEGDEGEILVKSPEMFSKYLFDGAATKAAHTEDGYYRTGDIARKEGEYYFIMGRANIDIIKSGGYKLSALDMEREILGLPYVAEVMVVGIPDEEFGERVAAAVVLKDERDSDTPVKDLTIQQLRADLRSRLVGYKMPTVLRIIGSELPKSGTGKVVKKVLGPEFFPKDYQTCPDVQVWRRQEGPMPKL